MTKDKDRTILSTYLASQEILSQSLTTLGYRIFNPQGYHWGLSTDGPFDQYFHEVMLRLCDVTYKEELIKVVHEQHSLFLRWGPPPLVDPFYSHLYAKGIGNIVAYYRQSLSCIEGFYFCGIRPDAIAPLVNSKAYMDHLAQDISNVIGKRGTVHAYDSQVDFSFSNPLMTFQTLSDREKVCLINYAFGKSIKHLSQMLQISPRTVETYLLRSKHKFGLKNKDQMVAFLLQTFDKHQLLEFLRFSAY